MLSLNSSTPGSIASLLRPLTIVISPWPSTINYTQVGLCTSGRVVKVIRFDAFKIALEELLGVLL